MADSNDIERVAQVLNIIRPDWPASSCKTLLTRDHSTRPYADLLIAAVAVAVDPKSATPARLAEFGPWWRAAQEANGHKATTTVGPGNEPRCDDHPQELARHCRGCAADAKAIHDDEES